MPCTKTKWVNRFWLSLHPKDFLLNKSLNGQLNHISFVVWGHVTPHTQTHFTCAAGLHDATVIGQHAFSEFHGCHSSDTERLRLYVSFLKDTICDDSSLLAATVSRLTSSLFFYVLCCMLHWLHWCVTKGCKTITLHLLVWSNRTLSEAASSGAPY